MRFLFITPVVLCGIAASGLSGCRSDAVSSPDRQLVMSAHRTSGDGSTLVVDDDRADCPRADFTTIQAAVDAAEPGTTIRVCAGTYHEWVVISKDGLRLLAQGKPGDVVLDGEGTAGTACSATSTTASHCAAFELRNAHGNLIEGFVVRRFWEAGIWLRMGSDGNTIRRNVATESPHHDGIQLANSSDNVIEHNLVVDNPAANACGVQVTAGSQRNVVRHNRLMNNEWGIQVAGGATDNVISANRSLHNRGNGIRNVGAASGTIIEKNVVLANGLNPTSATTGTTAAGIRLNTGTGLVVRGNQLRGNQSVDLLKEAGATAAFEHNKCTTSSPPGLCEPHGDDDDRESQ